MGLKLIQHKVTFAPVVLVVQVNSFFEQAAANIFQQNILGQGIGGDIHKLFGNDHFAHHLGLTDAPGHSQTGRKGLGGRAHVNHAPFGIQGHQRR